jgi:transcriptional regulator with XRE-family HTH domain
MVNRSLTSSEPTVEWIKERLQLERLQQRDLAVALGMDPSGVTRLLRGERKLKPAEIPLIIEFFSKFGGEGAEVPPRLAAAFGQPGVTMAAVAQRSGIDERRLLELKYGRGRGPSPEEAAALGTVFAVDGELLFSPTGVAADEREQLRRGWKEGATLRDAPRLGANVGDGGQRLIPIYGPPTSFERGLYLDKLEVVERRSPPAELVGVAGAFGIYIGDDHSSPLLMLGDIAFIHPSRPVRAGQRVLGRHSSGHMSFGILAWDLGSTSRLVTAQHQEIGMGQRDRIQLIVAIAAG